MKIIAFISLSLWVVVSLSAQPYNHYRGSLHSHTAFSDGNKDELTSGVNTPGGSFAYAKLSAYVDFWGISEHNHASAGMSSIANFQAGISQATSSTTSGFSALYGMEYGVISNGGHVLVYGIDSLIGWDANLYQIYNAKFDYQHLYSIVNSKPKAFLSLAHPNTDDYGSLLEGAFNTAADSAISATAIRSGGAFSTTTDYSDAPATSYESKYKLALAKGYHVAPLIDHDTHYTTFGRTTKGRTIILSSSLNQDSLLNAVKLRRVYASDDWNVTVNFTLNTSFMGSIVKIYSDPTITVGISDPDMEAVTKIEIFSGFTGSGSLPTVVASNVGQLGFVYSPTMAVNDSKYFYAKITQADGDLIWTAPIWVKKETAVLPIELAKFRVSLKDKQGVLNWTARQASNTVYIIEKSQDGLAFEGIGTVRDGEADNDMLNYSFTDTHLKRGVSFYRLKIIEEDNHVEYSQILSLYFKDDRFSFQYLFPNPSKDFMTLAFTSEIIDFLTYHIYDFNGREVFSNSFWSQRGLNQLTLDVNHLASGQYYLLVNQLNQRVLETKFIKD